MNPLHDFKSELKTFLIVAAMSAVLAVAGILLLQAGLGPSSPTSSPTPVPAAQTPPPAPTQGEESAFDDALYEGWSVYKDDQTGYSLKVPPAWINKEFIEPHSDDYFKVAFGEPDGILLYIDEEEAYKVYGGCNIVTVTAIPSKFSVEGTISQIMDNRSELNNAARSEFLVGSQRAIQFDESIFPFDPRDRNPQLDGFTTFVKHNDRVFMFVGRSCATEKDKFRDRYKMLLESVWFFGIPQQKQNLEQPPVDTSTWPLYTHSELGYSIRVHPDFQRRGDTERFLVLTDDSKSCRHTQDIESKKWIAAELDFRADSTGVNEESRQAYSKLLKADVNCEYGGSTRGRQNFEDGGY